MLKQTDANNSAGFLQRGFTGDVFSQINRPSRLAVAKKHLSALAVSELDFDTRFAAYEVPDFGRELAERITAHDQLHPGFRLLGGIAVDDLESAFSKKGSNLRLNGRIDPRIGPEVICRSWI